MIIGLRKVPLQLSIEVGKLLTLILMLYAEFSEQMRQELGISESDAMMLDIYGSVSMRSH